MIQTLTKINDNTLRSLHEEQEIRKTGELFLLFSLGSQFDHLIKQSLERLGVFCLVADPASLTARDVANVAPTGIILSGGPASVHAEPPPFDEKIFDLGIPTLGICLGFQLWAKHVGATVRPATNREFGIHSLQVLDSDSPIFAGIENATPVLESHGDRIEPSEVLTVLGSTVHAPVAAARCSHLWGVQFHPEVSDTLGGEQLFENFCFKICGARSRYPAQEVATSKVEELRKRIGRKRVLLALSGGSDSSVVAYLLKHAVTEQPGQIKGIYIRGIDRPDDEAHVKKYFGSETWLELEIIDATDAFLNALRGKTAMHEKRLAIRSVYKEVLEGAAKQFKASFIAQGTLYTDISESGSGYASGARKAQIKLHHNTNLNFSLPELAPLDDCVKDTARNIGRSLGCPEALLTRHPFPGPGLVVRIESEVNAENLAIARVIDAIYISELRSAGLYETIWQAGAVVTDSVTTCTKGDDASSGHVIALWAVWSVNGFTAQAAELPYDFLKNISKRITNEVRQAGNVVYRISDKPPTTIEWG